VRQALAFAIDKESLNGAITGGHGLVRTVYSHPNAEYYGQVIGAVPIKYAYDQRRAEALLLEGGFHRGPDNRWLTPNGQRFTLELWHLAGADNQRENTILVDELQRFGIDATGLLWGTQRTSN